MSLLLRISGRRARGFARPLATVIVASGLLSVTSGGTAGASNKSSVLNANANATLTYGATTPLVTFDPAKAQAGAEAGQYLGLVYDTLVGASPVGQPVPDLATSWKYNSSTELVFTLRTGVTYQDGSAFNATTAKESLERSIVTAGPRSSSLGPISQIEALNPTTLIIKLKSPDPDLLSTLSSAPCAILSPAAFTRPNLNLNPDGTGAYFYDAAQSTPGDHYTFTANPKWWDKKSVVRPETIVIKVIPDPTARYNAVQTGQVDFALINPGDAAQAKAQGLQVAAAPIAWSGFLIIDRKGTEVPAFASLKVRQAIALAFDRAAILKAVNYGYGYVSDQPFLKGTQGYDPALEKKFPYDPAKARKLIAESGFKNITFTAPVSSSVVLTGAEVDKAELAAIGITMNIQLIPPTQLAPAGQSTKYPVISFGFPNLFPYSRWLAQLAPGAGFNPFNVDDPTLDHLAAEYAAAYGVKPALANTLAKKMADREVEQGEIVVSDQVDSVVAYNPKITGVSVVYGAPDFAQIHFK